MAGNRGFSNASYRGRIAPTPTGYLHLGHAATFLTAQSRAHAAGGVLIYRCEDLDRARCRPEFAAAALADLRWAGLTWDEGPDVGGPFAPYRQSERLSLFEQAWRQLYAAGTIYPCRCSRKDVQDAVQAPHDNGGEAVYPGTCRPASGGERAAGEPFLRADGGPGPINWRFRVPDGRAIHFVDGRLRDQRFVAGLDFGDFLVWRKDGLPAYELAVVVDDAVMRISEVVRGEDLLVSTARQLLLYEALGWSAPAFYHCPLMRDESGRRLAKRNQALGLRELRARGVTPAELSAMIEAAARRASVD